jgi:hypothetical protein
MPEILFVAFEVISGYKRRAQTENNYSEKKKNTSSRIHTERPSSERISSGVRRRPIVPSIWYLVKALQLAAIVKFVYNQFQVFTVHYYSQSLLLSD